jgi:hypothetical protein
MTDPVVPSVVVVVPAEIVVVVEDTQNPSLSQTNPGQHCEVAEQRDEIDLQHRPFTQSDSVSTMKFPQQAVSALQASPVWAQNGTSVDPQVGGLGVSG